VHLGCDEPIGEYVGLFREFTVLKQFRCRKSVTVGANVSPLEP